MAFLILLLTLVSMTVAQVCVYNDTVELNNRMYNGVEYSDGEFFIDNTTGLERGCICMKEKCIRKCCPFGQGVHKEKMQCVDLQDTFDPPVWEGTEIKAGFNASKEFHILFGIPNCSETDNELPFLLSGYNIEQHVNTDGKYYVTIDESNQSAQNYTKYCIDNFFIEKKDKTRNIQLETVVCLKLLQEKNDTTRYHIGSICMLISCFFMLLTILVYIMLPALRTLHGMVLTTYLLSFFVGFLCMAIMQMSILWGEITSNDCLVLTFIIYFTVLAAFFWLNVLCYSLWTQLRLKTKNTSRRQYLSYCGYAFGMPTGLTIVLAALEFSDISKYNKFLPLLREQGCFLYGLSKFIYLYLPLTIICVANLALFILIARKIAQIKKQTQQVLKLKHKQRFSLYIELFIVTGLSWIFEVISFIYPDLSFLWYITDTYNCLVGLFIFIIFVCKKKVFLLIKQRFNELTGTPVRQISRSSSRTPSPSNEDIPMNTNTLIERI